METKGRPDRQSQALTRCLPAGTDIGPNLLVSAPQVRENSTRGRRAVTSSRTLTGYDAMEVEQTPWSVASERQSVESLLSTLEDVHKTVGAHG